MVKDIFVRLSCMIRILFFKIFKRKYVVFGKNSRFKEKCIFYANKHSSLIIGKNVFFNRNCTVAARKIITIGDDCLFGENVKIYDHNHIFNKKNKKINELPLKTGRITIGNNCWIGSNVVITKDTEIGDNCVIGAGLVVHGSIKPNTIIKNINGVITKEPIVFRD